MKRHTERIIVYLFGCFTLCHGVLEIREPDPVEEESGDAEDKVEGEVGPALVLGAVHEEGVGEEEAETQDNVHISEQCDY